MSSAGERERPPRAYDLRLGVWYATLFITPHPAHDGSFSGSVLFAYKINWQSVMFFGYGDERTLDDQRRLQRADRSIFVKLSYAFQR